MGSNQLKVSTLKLSTTIISLLLANCLFAQFDSLGVLRDGEDTLNYSHISEDLFACECYNLPDTFNFGLPRPLDNDFFMTREYGIYLAKRYGLDMNVYDIGMMYPFDPGPKGELLKDIWVGIILNKNVTDYAEDYYKTVEFILPVCSLEELYRSRGKGAINEELARVVNFELRKQKELWINR